MLHTRISLIISFVHSSVYRSVSISHSFHPSFPETETQIQRRNVKSESESPSYPTHCDPYSPWNSAGQNTGVGSLCLLQGIFPIQGSNAGLSHCRQILYQLSHKGSPTYIKEQHKFESFMNKSNYQESEQRLTESQMLFNYLEIFFNYLLNSKVIFCNNQWHGFSNQTAQISILIILL